MHHFLTEWPRVDHANGDGLDNRRANLRPASQLLNARNLRKRQGTSSRFKGVCRLPDGRWQANIRINGHSRHLGWFVDEEAAAGAYDNAARELFGEFAAVNFPQLGERGALS
jgi:hypothetical protein